MIKATVAFVHTNLQMLGLCWGSAEDGNDLRMFMNGTYCMLLHDIIFIGIVTKRAFSLDFI